LNHVTTVPKIHARITTLKTWKEENHLTFESVGWFHFILFIYIYIFF
jgi:hypothetical protein